MLALFLSSTLAHTALESPPPRYPSTGFSDNKACPCGVGLSNRLCDVPTDRSDPDRGTDLSTFAPGEEITVSWHEVVGHAGRYRIAFDPDGADLDDFNAHILLDIPDPAGNAGNTGIGDLWEVRITLPTEPCDTCTLQLIQMMDGNTVDPVPDPVGRSSYYQCSDIVIAGSSDTGDSAASATGDTAFVGTADTSTRETASATATSGDTAVHETADTAAPSGGITTADTAVTPTADTAAASGGTTPADTAATPTGPTIDTGSALNPTSTDAPTSGGLATNEAEVTAGCGCNQGGAGWWAGPPMLLLLLRRRQR